MGRERRGSAGLFYYGVHRDAEGRVVKAYLGRGRIPRVTAQAVSGRKAEAGADRSAVVREAATPAAVERISSEMFDGVGLLFEAYLINNGYSPNKLRPMEAEAWLGRQ
jgi:hypothetical protein